MIHVTLITLWLSRNTEATFPEIQVGGPLSCPLRAQRGPAIKPRPSPDLRAGGPSAPCQTSRHWSVHLWGPTMVWARTGVGRAQDCGLDPWVRADPVAAYCSAADSSWCRGGVGVADGDLVVQAEDASEVKRIVPSASPAAARASTNPASTSVSKSASSSGPAGRTCLVVHSRTTASPNPRLHTFTPTAG